MPKPVERTGSYAPKRPDAPHTQMSRKNKT